MFPVVDLEEKLAQIKEFWHPHIIGELNGQQVKLAKLKGEFVWHSHAEEDELFYVVKGSLIMHFRDRKELIESGQFIIVPKGMEHKPEAKEEVAIMLFEPATTVNTGATESELTREHLDRL